MEGKNDKLFDLNVNHLNSIVVRIFKTDVDQKVKDNLLEQVLGDDQSDKAKNLRLTCRATSSDPKIKEEIWELLTDPKSASSLYEKTAMMRGFYVAN